MITTLLERLKNNLVDEYKKANPNETTPYKKSSLGFMDIFNSNVNLINPELREKINQTFIDSICLLADTSKEKTIEVHLFNIYKNSFDMVKIYKIDDELFIRNKKHVKDMFNKLDQDAKNDLGKDMEHGFDKQFNYKFLQMRFKSDCKFPYLLIIHSRSREYHTDIVFRSLLLTKQNLERFLTLIQTSIQNDIVRDTRQIEIFKKKVGTLEKHLKSISDFQY